MIKKTTSNEPGWKPGATDAPLVDTPHELAAEAAVGQGGRLPRALALLLALAAGWICIQAVTGLKEIIAPVFFALNLMIAAYPLKTWLTGKRLPEWLGAVITGAAVIVLLVAFFWSLGWAATSLVQRLPDYESQFHDLYDQGIAFLAQFGMSEESLTQQLESIDPGQVLPVAQKALSGVSNIASLLAVIATVLIFMVMDAMGFGERMDIAREHNPTFAEALGAFAQGVRRYWVVSTVFGIIVAFLDLGALLALGIPLAGVWAVLSFVTNYIPNIGFVIGVVPPALMALLDGGPVKALIVIAVYSVLNFVVQSVIQPKFAGDAVGVTPTVSFISLLFWAAVMGPLGAILALPATLLVKAILIDADPANRWLNAFIAAKPKTAGRPQAAIATMARSVPGAVKRRRPGRK